MKVITVLKYSMNFIFLAFLITAILVLAVPFYDHSYLSYGTSEIFWMLIVFPGVHLILIFMILFYLRKFVLNSAIGTPLDRSTRKYLKLSGIFCIIYGLLRIPEITSLITFYKVTGEYDISLITDSFLDFGSLFYIILFGLFFIYLSIVLESSDEIRQENELTI